jgi:hypothetical protein
MKRSVKNLAETDMSKLHHFFQLSNTRTYLQVLIVRKTLILFFIAFSLVVSGQSERKDSVATTARKDIRGKISGKISDDNGRPMTGVTVMLEGTVSKQEVSKVDGSYEFSNLPAGTYTISTSSVSHFSAPVSQIEVVTKDPVLVEIQMQIKSKDIGEVVVQSVSRRQNTAAGLVSRQKALTNISDGISSDLIAKATSSDLGDLLKILPGITTQGDRFVVIRGLGERYNGGMLNGMLMPSTELNRRNFSYDIIPTDVLDNVVVYKTWTPDLPGEFGGGLIQVNIKEVPPGKFTRISFGAGYNSRITGRDFITYRRSNSMYLATFGNSRRLSFQQAYRLRPHINDPNYSHTDLRNLQELGFYDGMNRSALYNEELVRYTAEPNTSFQVSHGNNITLKSNKSIGYLVALSYRNTQGVNDDVRTAQFGAGYIGNEGNAKGTGYSFQAYVSAVAGVTYRTKNSKITLSNFWNRSLVNSNFVGFSDGLDGTTFISPDNKVYHSQEYAVQNTMFQSILKGDHTLGLKKIKMQWSLGYMNFEKVTPDVHGSFFVVKKIDSSYAFNPYVNLDLNVGPTRFFTFLKDKTFFSDLNFSIPYRLFKADQLFRIGGQAIIRKRDFDLTYVRYSAGPEANPNKPLPLYFQPENDILVRGEVPVGTYTGLFSKTMPLYAGFVMTENKFFNNKLKLVTGARAEFVDLNEANQNFEQLQRNYAQSGTFADLSTAYQDSWNVLPQAALTYGLSKKINLRLAYARTLVRPDIRELSSTLIYDYELGGDFTIGTGAIIRTSKIDHYDFRFEWYPGGADLFTISPFYKYFSLPMEIVKTNVGFSLINTHSAKTYGVETEVRKSLAFTEVPVIKNLSVGLNFILMDSEVRRLITGEGRNQFWQLDSSDAAMQKYGRPTVTYIARADTIGYIRRLLTGQSNLITNFILYYDSKWVNVSVSYNYTSNRAIFTTNFVDRDATLAALKAEPDSAFFPQIINFGNSGTTFEKVPGKLDLQIATSALFKGKMEIKLNISNIADTRSIFYTPVIDRKSTAVKLLENNGRNVPFSSFFYKEGRDNVFNQYRTGRTFSLSVSYKF